MLFASINQLGSSSLVRSIHPLTLDRDIRFGGKCGVCEFCMIAVSRWASRKSQSIDQNSPAASLPDLSCCTVSPDFPHHPVQGRLVQGRCRVGSAGLHGAAVVRWRPPELWVLRLPPALLSSRQRSRGALEFSCSGVVCPVIVAQWRGVRCNSCAVGWCALEFWCSGLVCTGILAQRCGVPWKSRQRSRAALWCAPRNPPSCTPGYPAPPARFREYLPPRASCAGTDWTTLISAPRRSF